jgi:Tfp pilus assembly protein FimV
MNIKEQINGILIKYGVKLSVGEASETAVAQVEFIAKATTSDGVEIMSPDAELAIGSEVFYNDEEGNPIALPDGEYLINDGAMTISVSGGKITEMEEVEIEAKKNKEEEEMSSVIEQLAQRIADLESKINTKDTELAAVNKLLTEQKAKVAELSKAPAAPSVKKAALAATPQSDVVELPKTLENPIARKIFAGLRKAN